MKRFQRPLDRKALAVVALAVSAAWAGRGGSPSSGADAPSTRPVAVGTVSATEVARNFRSYQLMVPQPIRVRPGQSALCASAAPAAAPNPSRSAALAALLVYMNAPAASAFAEQVARYPVGAIVVKEKLSSKAPATRPTAPGATSQPAAGADGPAHPTWEAGSVGGMIKRAPGFAPANGDWEYFWVENPADRNGKADANPRRDGNDPRVESGQIASCTGCHQGRPTRDHVFGSWANPVNPQ